MDGLFVGQSQKQNATGFFTGFMSEGDKWISGRKRLTQEEEEEKKRKRRGTPGRFIVMKRRINECP